MPYIRREDRLPIDDVVSSLIDRIDGVGKLNYAVTTLVHHYINKNGLRYETINAAIGVLTCVLLELYRVVCSPYEDSKMEENGVINIIRR